MKRVFLLLAAASIMVACGGENKGEATEKSAEAITEVAPEESNVVKEHIPHDIRKVKANAELPEDIAATLKVDEKPTGKSLAQRAAEAIKTGNEAELKAIDEIYYQFPLSEQEAYKAELNNLMSR